MNLQQVFKEDDENIFFKTKPDKEEDIIKILHPAVKEWFFKKFKSFSLPQKYGILEVHSRNNILVSAPTGATKTLTAFLSVINELIDLSDKGILEDKVYAVYVSPLKALNYDIEYNLKTPLKEIEEILGKETGIRIMTRTGDTTASEKSTMLKKPPHILITTPESLAISLNSKKFREKLTRVDWMIIDEIHAIAENKRGTHLALTIEFLDELNNFSITRIGLSATVAPIKEIAKFLVGYEKQKNNVLNIIKTKPCKIVDVQFIKELDLKVISPVKDYIYTDYQTQHVELYKLLNKLIQEHKTTLIFTNTRAATERVVDTLKNMFPKTYNENTIAAHHSSLGKEHRFGVEQKLREGKLKCVVSSTSLELGIDIGYIDLVILLSSPKSVARALQRCGRSGHQLTSITKGRLVTMNRDDLVECSILLKDAIEKKIDKVHIPENALDVLSQQIFGYLQNKVIKDKELYDLIISTYPYRSLKYSDYISVLNYLSGRDISLEERNVYAKIFYFDDGNLKARGKLARVIYMTNVGTIPDEARIKVKLGKEIIGFIDEAFLERLKKGDVFVLGGNTYEFRYAQGNTVFVKTNINRPPTIPNWVSEMLPLSFDLANDISKFRRLISEKFDNNRSKKEVIEFIKGYLYLDDTASNAIYTYFYEQYLFSLIPHDKRIVVESFYDGSRHYSVFHTMYGRRVNDVLSRAVAFFLSVKNKMKFDIGVNDNGFYVSNEKNFNLGKPFESLIIQDIRKISEKAIENTEVLKRRFRHCAIRSLMILRQYKSNVKSVSIQQFSAQRLLKYLNETFDDFPILKEAKREVLEDLMDINNAEKVLDDIKDNKIKIEYVNLKFPSPFATNIVLEGRADILNMEKRVEFIKDLHKKILADISRKTNPKLKKVELQTLKESFSYEEFWKEIDEKQEFNEEQFKESLKIEFMSISDEIKGTLEQKQKVIDLINGMKDFDEKFIKWLTDLVYNQRVSLSDKFKNYLKQRLTEIS